MRAITHIHTRHSSDGTLSPTRLVESLSSAGVELAVVSDHDSYAGAIECRRIVAARNLPLHIPVAAEIRTERGDVIVVFEDDENLPAAGELKQWERLVTMTRDHGGLIWLAHPYRGHDYVEHSAAQADVIEVFNARCSAEENRNAALLCERHGAVPGYGADVHRASEIAQCVVDYEFQGSVLETLREAPTPLVTDLALKSSVAVAEITHGWRTRRPLLMAYFALRWAQHRKRERAAERTP